MPPLVWTPRDIACVSCGKDLEVIVAFAAQRNRDGALVVLMATWKAEVVRRPFCQSVRPSFGRSVILVPVYDLLVNLRPPPIV